MEFEKSLNRLEEIVQKMERGEAPLEESLELFEEGMNLLAELKEYLSKAEIKIEKLIKDSEGKIKTDEYKELSQKMEEES
ncbi:MAG: exodeoxyribonuclease VII small subunit [candidate division WOR-3 bacterium]|nr:exodeoxyribonuclease VII small subunit [candidate division WOR-3 bacterium]